MFDILVYLFESYIHTDAFPETDLLTRKLSAAGFDQEDISEALDWLAGLRRVSRDIHPGLAPSAGSVRIYTDEEQAQLDPRCRGFLSLLESAGVLSAAHRELIIGESKVHVYTSAMGRALPAATSPPAGAGQ